MRIIIHNIINSWRKNLWVFLELIVAGCFLWLVLQPICVFVADRMIPSGYDSHCIYTLDFELYDSSLGALYNQEDDTDELRSKQYHHILNLLSSCPEIEAVAMGTGSCFPMSLSMDGDMLRCEGGREVSMQKYIYWAIEGNQPEKVLALKDAKTGTPLQLPKTFWKGDQEIAISKNLALSLFGSIDVIGKNVQTFMGNSMRVVAVFQDIKQKDTEKPYPLALVTEPLSVNSSIAWQAILFRLKAGVDKYEFRNRFEREVVPVINQGNYAYLGMKSLDQYSDEMMLETGITGRLRMNIVFVSFVLLCIFLGMLGTFWIHAQNRQTDTGLLRSLGATKAYMLRQYYFEVWLLVTVAFIFVLLILYQIFPYLPSDLFYVNQKLTDDSLLNTLGISNYWQDQPKVRFVIISMITYLLILIISWLGVSIPVFRSLSQNPSESLNEE